MSNFNYELDSFKDGSSITIIKEIPNGFIYDSSYFHFFMNNSLIIQHFKNVICVFSKLFSEHHTTFSTICFVLLGLFSIIFQIIAVAVLFYYAKYLYNISKDLGYDIALKFYPDSKTPHLELSLDETIKLNHYITDRVDQLTMHPLLKLFRKYTLSNIYEMTLTTKKVKDSKVLKFAEKYGIDEVYKASMTAINIVNPVYWLRRIANEQVLERILVQIGLAIISITGEETYKIYSKKVFDVDVKLTSGVDEIYDHLDDELRGA
jgi:hypothetical protein